MPDCLVGVTTYQVMGIVTLTVLAVIAVLFAPLYSAVARCCRRLVTLEQKSTNHTQEYANLTLRVWKLENTAITPAGPMGVGPTEEIRPYLKLDDQDDDRDEVRN